MTLFVDRRIGGHPRYFTGEALPKGWSQMVPPEIPSSVVFLCASMRGREPYPKGTGFFLRRIEEGREFYYLVTARHIIESIDGMKGSDHKVHVRVNVPGLSYRFIETVVAGWQFHPHDQAADVAVYSVSDEEVRGAAVRFMPYQADGIPETIADRHGPGDEVIVAGLLLNHYGKRRNLPIIRVGHLAAMPNEPIEMPWSANKAGRPMEAYLVDSRSIGGLSGSPVYIRPTPQSVSGKTERIAPVWWNERADEGMTGYWLLGLIHGYVSVHRNELRPVDDGDEDKKNSGIAVVVPQDKIRETMDQPIFAERRRAVLDSEMRQRAK